MNTQLILKTIQKIEEYINSKEYLSDEECNMFGITITALRRQIPRGPQYNYHNHSCPCCKAEIASNEDMEYCPYCGQKISWGEEE